MMQYPFADMLIHKLMRLGNEIEAQFNARMASFGISIPMYRVLVVLVKNPGPHTLNTMARTLGIDPSTMSRQITTMTKLGLVTRDRPSDNGRIVQIAITPRGHEIAAQLIPFAQQVDQMSRRNLTAEQQKVLEEMLEAVRQNFRELMSDEAVLPS
jgi:DNA-binding MarR family transcriptional regulator